jgi:hypothetical protein
LKSLSIQLFGVASAICAKCLIFALLTHDQLTTARS